MKKATHEHVVSMRVDDREQCLILNTTGVNLEVFVLRTEQEIEDIIKRRQKKAAKKSKKTGEVCVCVCMCVCVCVCVCVYSKAPH